MQPHCANVDDSSRSNKKNPQPTKSTAIRKQTAVSAKSTTPKDNDRSESKLLRRYQ